MSEPKGYVAGAGGGGASGMARGTAGIAGSGGGSSATGYVLLDDMEFTDLKSISVFGAKQIVVQIGDNVTTFDVPEGTTSVVMKIRGSK